MVRRSVVTGLLATLTGLVLAAPAFGAGDPVMPLSQVHRGMRCTARSVVQGTTISTFDVEVLDVVDGTPDEDARILIRVSGAAVDSTGIGPGFSGSPVYCRDGNGVNRVAGAISEGIGEYGNKTVLATPIEQILGEPVVPPSSARSRPQLLRSARPLSLPLAISGLPRSVASGVQDGARRAHRTLLAAPSGAAGRFSPQPLIPGASVSVGYSSGDLALGAIGAVTYRDGNNLWAFGHPFDRAGRRSLFLQDAYVYGVINNPIGSDLSTYKLAAPGHDEGTITGDATSAVSGTVGALPPATPVTVTAKDLDTGRLVVSSSSVADETAVGSPVGELPLDFVTPLAALSAATSLFHGSPAQQAGRACLRIVIREASKPLGFCKRYVFVTGGGDAGGGSGLASAIADDVSGALSLVDATSFAALHVRSVRIVIRAQRGPQLAYLRSARAPRAARAGHRVRVRVRERRYRAATLAKTYALRLPRKLSPGRHPVVLIGTGEDGFGSSVSDIFFQVFSDSGSSPSDGGDAGPQSVGAVARQVSALGGYDGVKAVFPGAGPRGHPLVTRAFSDRGLRLSGSTRLVVRVAGRR
ncbi:MAG: hypothetical protein ACR2K9_06290 [Solirubrobacteraceae bacterium]